MKALALITLLVGSLALVGTGDYEEAKASQERYCEMVALHHDTGGQAGWPPYKGECDE